MDKNKFEKIVKSNNFQSYLLDCQDKASKSSERVWEKSIPLWIAVYFKEKGVSEHLFDGNYGCNLKHLEKEHKGNKQLLKKIETVRAILKVAGKQENSAHADFSVNGAKKNPFGMTAVGMLEIKSLAGYQKSGFDKNQIFQDICMCLAYNIVLGKTGSAFMLFINSPYGEQERLEKEKVMKYLENKFKTFPKEVEKWKEILIWIQSD